jgi:hypothetical protein
MPSGTGVRDVETPGAAARLQYRLEVLGCDSDDVVRSAGGWLFDRAMAGWAVDVWLADACDARPLLILGTRVHRLADRGSRPEEDGAVSALAVAGALVTADRAVGAEVAGALRTGHTEVVAWGANWPGLLGGSAGAVRYQLSAAARTFKRQALIASRHADVTVGDTEMMISAGFRPYDSDLAAGG